MCEGFEAVTPNYASRVFASNSYSRADCQQYTGRFGVGNGWGRQGGQVTTTVRYFLDGQDFGYSPNAMTYIVGFALKKKTGGNEFLCLSHMLTGSYTDAWGIEVSDTAVRVKAWDAIYPAYDYPYTLGSWVYIELKFRGHASLGTYEAKANGTTLYSWGPGDTLYSTSNNHVGFFLGDEAWMGWEIDDLYFLAVDGSGQNDFLGDSRVDTILATGAGNSTQFTPSAGANYECVNEDPNDEADYLEGDTDGQKDTFAYADVPTDIDDNNIYGVCIDNHAKRTQPVAGLLSRNVLRSGGTDYYGPQDYILGDSTSGWKRSTWELDPDDSQPWTQAKINACEFGVELDIV